MADQSIKTLLRLFQKNPRAASVLQTKSLSDGYTNWTIGPELCSSLDAKKYIWLPAGGARLMSSGLEILHHIIAKTGKCSIPTLIWYFHFGILFKLYETYHVQGIYLILFKGLFLLPSYCMTIVTML